MNNRSPNNNFLEEEVEYEEVPESEITDADEILEDIEQDDRNNQETMKALSEAEKRIEQANLYKAILNSNLFGPGSARPEIIRTVDKEFKEFVMYRLEVLLGIKQDGQARGSSTQSAKSEFSANQVAALKDLANKLIKRDGPQAAPQPTVVTPVIQPVVGNSEPTVQQVGESAEAPQVKMVRRVVKRTNIQAPGQPAQPATKQRGRARSNNTSVITGEDLSQAVNPLRPPVKMPSQAHMNAMNAEQAEKNARAKASESGALATALTTLLK